VSREVWRKWLPYTPIAAVILVILIALALYLALSGPSSGTPQNQAQPPVVVLSTVEGTPVSPTPLVPPAAETPTFAPTAVPSDVAQARDQTRISDLHKIAVALEQYKSDKGEYPSTGDNVQSGCSYPDLDALCKLKDYLDPIPSDPAGDPVVVNGYWYVSDGKTFTLIAGVDLAADGTPAKCEQGFYDHTKKTDLYCLTSVS
jgi:type II secretory pathway pseudopilin PulG